MAGRNITRAEAKLWRAVLADVTPLPGRAPPPADEPPPPASEPPPSSAPAVPAPARSPAHRPPGHAYELRHGHTPNIDRRTADRLKRGEMEIDGRIDLHGLTQEAAHVALNGFIARSYAMGRRCVLVITGKGQRQGTGVLRSAVPHWLNDSRLRPAILAFSHARPQDGGEGALYVLLKRQR
jgi:DNA-nicking Smr family endonuclease